MEPLIFTTYINTDLSFYLFDDNIYHVIRLSCLYTCSVSVLRHILSTPGWPYVCIYIYVHTHIYIYSWYVHIVDIVCI
jgi:hypothetical protein